jgi:hypothetical protein
MGFRQSWHVGAQEIALFQRNQTRFAARSMALSLLHGWRNPVDFGYFRIIDREREKNAENPRT